MMLLRHGQVFFETYWEPYSAGNTPLLYSISKTFTSAAVGLAVADGALSYDDRIVDLLGNSGAGPKASTIRVRDCLAMATGHTVDEVIPFRTFDLPGDGPWQAYLAIEPEGTPGETFCYHQWASYLLAQVVQRRVGKDVLQLLNERVLGPLGVSDASWDTDAQGRILGWTGLHLSTESIAAFFQLLLDGGVSAGVRLLPEEWIEQHSVAHADTSGHSENHDWQLGYGWQVWRSSFGYRADGMYGQFGIVLPDHDMVIVMTGGDQRMQSVLEKVWEHLIPAVDAASDADDYLAGVATGLRLAPVWGERGASVQLSFENRKNRWRLTDDPDGWELRWVDSNGGDNKIAVGHHSWRFGTMEWRRHHMPIAASGAWVGWGHFVVKIVSLTSPHWRLLHLRDDGSGLMEWNNPPLVGRSMRDVALPKRG